jgi:hypothetical protein
MIEVSISGRSVGLAASSNINIFSVQDDNIAGILARKLGARPEIELPFGIIGIYVEALDHKIENVSEEVIELKSIKKLMKHNSGKAQKMFELTIASSFYVLSVEQKMIAIARAFASISKYISVEFPTQGGLALAQVITESVTEYKRAASSGT